MNVFELTSFFVFSRIPDSSDKMYKMKKYLVIFIATFYFGNASSQKASLEIEWGKAEVIINKTAINVNSTLADIRKVLGKESRFFSADDKTTRLYIYDQHGLNFIIDTVAGKLDKIDIEWSPGRSQSEYSPKELFTGNFSVNGKPVLVTDGISSIKKNTRVPFEKMGLFYWYTADDGQFSITIAYATKAEQKIRAVHIIFRQSDDE